MATTTTRLALRKPAGTDTVNVATDINASMDTIDTVVGFTNASSTTRPSAPFVGQGVLESDTGAAIVSNGSAPASGSWTYLIGTGGPAIVGATGSAAAVRLRTTSTIGANRAVGLRANADTQDAYTVDFDGKTQWGPGGSTALDTNLYRSAAATLKTDTAFIVAGTLTASGAMTVSGNLTASGSGSTIGGLAVTGVAGGRRYVTGSTLATTSGTTEILAGVDTGTLSLDANTTYMIECQLNINVSVANDTYDFIIRDTNIGGTVRYQAIAGPCPAGVPLVVQITFLWKTTTAVSIKWVVSMQRIAGSGTCSVTASSNGSTYAMATRYGPSANITDV